ncbi:DUF7694 domain-containing protein [Bradyrhizobium erythrophlei]|uniref:DUF7694 domain-containing protein n=1 Tax=Bradyrhizobium erythrophlei TaxID=1437360 RepID=UPI001FCD4161|nr:hypothetical protein [Bradyrhizobium erythrophlei]
MPEKLEFSRAVDCFGPNAGHNGRFLVQGPSGCQLQLISYDGEQSGWEQVSVSTGRRRSPNWLEMCFAKDLFWDEEECVVQYHPPLSQYVKNDRWCLHLWKPKHEQVPAPPSNLVGIVGVGPHEMKLWVDAQVAEIFARCQQSTGDLTK